ncbi:MAG: hypothetical protein EXR36_11480 [Betaproteobacteria bacterium]|nr:hypothetical protein [Betaproteobacteria bacterium]
MITRTRTVADNALLLNVMAGAPWLGFAACNRVILLSEACAVHARWLRERPQDYSALTRSRLLPGLFLSATDYVQASRWRARLTARMEETLANVDVAITASSMDAPYPINDAAEMERCYPRQARTPFNLTGHPALALPVGFTAGGLPLGTQIIGKHWDEATVYRAARAYERETTWHTMHPALEN